MNLIFNKYGSTLTIANYVMGNDYRNKHSSRMKEAWSVLTQKLDNKLMEVNAVVSQTEFQGYTSVTQTMESALKQDSFSSYMSNESMSK